MVGGGDSFQEVKLLRHFSPPLYFCLFRCEFYTRVEALVEAREVISPGSRKKDGVVIDTSLAGVAAADAAARGSLAAAHVTVWWPCSFFCCFPGMTLSWHVRDKRCRPDAIVRGTPLRPHRRGIAAVPLRVAIIVSSFESEVCSKCALHPTRSLTH